MADYVPVDKLSPALAACSRNGNGEGARVVLSCFYKRMETCDPTEWESQRDFYSATLRHCMEIAASKGQGDVAALLKKEAAKVGNGGIGGGGRHSAADLIGKKKSMQNVKKSNDTF